MKISHKLAGVFACGAFILVSLTVYFADLNPMSLLDSALNPDELDQVVDTSLERPIKVLTLALPSALLAGVLGYLLGGVLGAPKGGQKASERKKIAQAARSSGETALVETSPALIPENVETGAPLTGEEIFLDDVTPAVSVSSPETSRAQ